MGGTLCPGQSDSRPRPASVQRGVNKDRIEVYGYLLNADSRALLLCLRIAGLENYEYVEVDMLKQEHQEEEFLRKFPSGTLPVMVEGQHTIYGTSQIQMQHICNRYQRAAERFCMSENKHDVNKLFSNFDSRIRPVTQRIRRMVLAKALGLKPAPTEEQMSQDFEELTERIIPMLNEQLLGRTYFCGEEISIYDLQVFCELNSILAIAEDEVKPAVTAHQDLADWRTAIYIVAAVQELED